jgi:hypothetical protein
MRTPLLKHTQIIRLARLLDMLYRPAELAAEIGVHVDTVYRSYMPAGCPFTRDGHSNIWIHGPAFTDWARRIQAEKHTRRAGLPDGHAWCMRCNHPVPLIDPTRKPINRRSELLQSRCPDCGTPVNRAGRIGGAA